MPEPSSTAGAVEPGEACVEEEAPAEAGLIDIANILGAPTVTVAREVLEYEYKELFHECVYHMELREASDHDLVNCYKSL
jgi:hypothetical protein